MALKSKIAIFDSSGLVSLVKSDDQLHDQAVEIANTLTLGGWHILLPYEVLAESLNTIGKLVSKQAALTVGDALMRQYAARSVDLTQSSQQIVQRALERLGSAPGSPSFVDCLVMAHADEQQTRYVFGFDATFKKNGYMLPDGNAGLSQAA